MSLSRHSPKQEYRLPKLFIEMYVVLYIESRFAYDNEKSTLSRVYISGHDSTDKVNIIVKLDARCSRSA